MFDSLRVALGEYFIQLLSIDGVWFSEARFGGIFHTTVRVVGLIGVSQTPSYYLPQVFSSKFVIILSVRESSWTTKSIVFVSLVGWTYSCIAIFYTLVSDNRVMFDWVYYCLLVLIRDGFGWLGVHGSGPPPPPFTANLKKIGNISLKAHKIGHFTW